MNGSISPQEAASMAKNVYDVKDSSWIKLKNMKAAETVADLTEQFMRSILLRLMRRMSEEAQRAIQGLMTKR